jgi:hypothetical protein
VAANGKSENGDIHRTGAEAFQEDGRNFFDDREPNLREFVREGSEPRREEIRRNCRDHADAKRAGNGIFALDNLATGGFKFTENGAGAGQEGLPEIGETNGAAEPVEKPGAKFVFEFENLLGEGRLRDMRLFGGTAERACFGYRAEVTELMKLHVLRLKIYYRQCLSILSELYIGSIEARALRFEAGWRKRVEFPRLRAH